jgi:hypothetical protein
LQRNGRKSREGSEQQRKLESLMVRPFDREPALDGLYLAATGGTACSCADAAAWGGSVL